MATRTLGTNATTTLTAVQWAQGGSGLLPADIATINNGIKSDMNNIHRREPGAFVREGLLYIPARGVLKLFPGDYVGIDSQGWPILVSKNSITNGPWTHT